MLYKFLHALVKLLIFLICLPIYIYEKFKEICTGVAKNPEASVFLLLYLVSWCTVIVLYRKFAIENNERSHVITKEIGTFFLGGFYVLFQVFGKLLGMK